MVNDKQDTVQGQPTPDGGGQPDAQSSAGNVPLEVVLKRIDELEKQFKGIQSGTDKQTAKALGKLNELNKTLDEQLAKYEQYREAKLNPAEAKRQMLIDMLIEQQIGNVIAPEDKGKASPPPKASEDIDDELLGLLDIDPKDPKLAKLISEGNTTLAAVKQIAREGKGNVTPTPAGITSAGGSGSQTTNQASLRAAYQQELDQIKERGIAAISVQNAITAKYRRLGLESV